MAIVLAYHAPLAVAERARRVFGAVPKDRDLTHGVGRADGHDRRGHHVTDEHPVSFARVPTLDPVRRHA